MINTSLSIPCFSKKAGVTSKKELMMIKSNTSGRMGLFLFCMKVIF
jgi:hypothetical protein